MCILPADKRYIFLPWADCIILLREAWYIILKRSRTQPTNYLKYFTRIIRYYFIQGFFMVYSDILYRDSLGLPGGIIHTSITERCECTRCKGRSPRCLKLVSLRRWCSPIDPLHLSASEPYSRPPYPFFFVSRDLGENMIATWPTDIFDGLTSLGQL